MCWVRQAIKECDAVYPRRCVVWLASDNTQARARRTKLLKHLACTQLLLCRTLCGTCHALHTARDVASCRNLMRARSTRSMHPLLHARFSARTIKMKSTRVAAALTQPCDHRLKAAMLTAWQLP